MNSSRSAEGLLLVTAAIWGFAFVAQRAGMEHVGPFTFNGIRFAMGSLVLVPFIFLTRSSAPSPPAPLKPVTGSFIAAASVLSGLILFGGASFQQMGLVHTTAGKAGFITGLYIIIVPVAGVILRRPPRWQVWAGAGLAVGGLYFLSVRGGFAMGRGDLLVLASAFCFAGHVVLLGRISPRLPTLVLASIQFGVCALLSFAVALGFEEIRLTTIEAAAGPILYAGLLSTGVAYTLQVFGQRRVPPARAAIIMSLEAVFAALGGWILLSEKMDWRSILGCGLMLGGMVLSQWKGSGAKGKVRSEG